MPWPAWLPGLVSRGRDLARRVLASKAFWAALLVVLVSVPGLLLSAVLVMVVLFAWSVSPEFALAWSFASLVIWAAILGVLAWTFPPEQGWDRELRRILRKTEQGNRDAILALARIHEEGRKGFRSDPSQALWWLRRLAERGDAEAAYRLSQLLLGGQGLVRDRTAARAWLRTAADAGHPEARRDLAALEDSAKYG